jgi:metal-dependent hydrolase (beta-lactamase superfamily II)
VDKTKVQSDAESSQTGTKGDVSHSVLFDAGPEEDAWERNAKRLRADLASVEVIQLSHWHRDHSGLFEGSCGSLDSG